MKKISLLILSLLMLFSATACGKTVENTPETTTEATLPPYAVPSPMAERPSYAVSENPTTDELRQTAVRAMHEMLSIQWTTETAIDYNKKGAVSGKDYHYDPYLVYCGLPYADGQTNIYVWLEYYDYRSGLLRLEGDGQWLNDTLGNTCAGSLMWAWSTVCDSLTGNFVNYNMVQQYGCIPVGSYTYDSYISSFKQQTTKSICEKNGDQVMFESYAQMKAADAITSSTTEHTLMAISDAVVVYLDDGSIDTVNSYIMVQDQAAGVGDKFREYEEDGITYFYTGRTGPIALKCTFQWMREKDYIPVTTAEFLGQDPYVKAQVSFSMDACNNLSDLLSGAFTCNYPMCMLKINATDASGNKTTLYTKYFDRTDVGDGIARNYKLTVARSIIDSAVKELPAGEYTLEAEVTASTGDVFTPVSFTHTK